MIIVSLKFPAAIRDGDSVRRNVQMFRGHKDPNKIEGTYTVWEYWCDGFRHNNPARSRLWIPEDNIASIMEE